MTSPFRWEVRGDKDIVLGFGTLPERMVNRLEVVIRRHIEAIKNAAQAKVSGGVLKLRTGALRDALGRGTSVSRSDTRIVGKVGLAGADAKTAIAGGAQEYGATIAAHIVRAVNTSKLRFTIDGKFFFAKQVLIQETKIPEHSFLRSSLREQAPLFARDVVTVVGTLGVEG